MPRRTDPYRIAIRDQRLRGGRMDISARTTSKPTYRRREAAIRALMDAGEWDVIDRLRSRELHIADVQRAVEAGEIETLRRQAAEPLSLRAVLDRQLRAVRALTRASTYANYETLRNRLLEHFGPGQDIREVGAADAEAFLHRPWPSNDDQPWSAGRQQVLAAMAGRLWQREIDREMELAERHQATPRITRNPWKAAETPKDYPTRSEWLRPNEWRDLWRVVEGKRDAALYAVGCLAGLRLSEALHLRPGIDVDLDARLIRVQSREGEHEWRPKNPKRGERDVPICDELYAALAYHQEHFAGARFFFRLPDSDRPISHTTVVNWTRESYTAAGIRYGRREDGLTFHSLRHTFASWLVQADVQLLKVARLLGDTVDQVVRTYAHLMPSDLERAVRVLDETVGNQNHDQSTA